MFMYEYRPDEESEDELELEMFELVEQLVELEFLLKIGDEEEEEETETDALLSAVFRGLKVKNAGGIDGS